MKIQWAMPRVHGSQYLFSWLMISEHWVLGTLATQAVDMDYLSLDYRMMALRPEKSYFPPVVVLLTSKSGNLELLLYA